MTNSKRFLAMLLCILMCFSMLPTWALAEGEETVGFNEAEEAVLADSFLEDPIEDVQATEQPVQDEAIPESPVADSVLVEDIPELSEDIWLTEETGEEPMIYEEPSDDSFVVEEDQETTTDTGSVLEEIPVFETVDEQATVSDDQLPEETGLNAEELELVEEAVFSENEDAADPELPAAEEQMGKDEPDADVTDPVISEEANQGAEEPADPEQREDADAAVQEQTDYEEESLVEIILSDVESATADAATEKAGTPIVTKFTLSASEVTAPATINAEITYEADPGVSCELLRIGFIRDNMDNLVTEAGYWESTPSYSSETGRMVYTYTGSIDVSSDLPAGKYKLAYIHFNSNGNFAGLFGEGIYDYDTEPNKLPADIASMAITVKQNAATTPVTTEDPATTADPVVLDITLNSKKIYTPGVIQFQVSAKDAYNDITVWFKNTRTGKEDKIPFPASASWSVTCKFDESVDSGKHVISRVELKDKTGNTVTYYGKGSSDYSSAAKKLPENLAGTSFTIIHEEEIPTFDLSKGSLVIKSNGIRLYWNKTNAAKYSILRKASNESSYKSVGKTTKLSFLDKKAVSGVKYSYKIRALDASGKTIATSSAESVTFYSAPVISKVSSTKLGVKFSWNKVKGVSYYCVERMDPDKNAYQHLSMTSSATFTDRTAVVGHKYKYRIYCCDSNGWSISADTVKTVTYKPKGVTTVKGKTRQDGQFHQTEARSMLKMINEFRTEKNVWYWNSDNSSKTVFNTDSGNQLGKLKYDYTLEKIAMERARETAVYWSHTRPNGQPFSALVIDGVHADGENITARFGAGGFKTAKEAMTQLREDNSSYSGQGHRRTMLNPNYSAVGFGCFTDENGNTLWVQVFSYGQSGASKTAANNSRDTALVEFSKDVTDAETYQYTRLEDVTITDVSYTGKGIHLSWDKVLLAKKYQISRRVKGGKWAVIATTSKLEYTDTKVKKGTEYQYRVRPKNGSIPSEYSEVKTMKALPVPVISSVKAVSAGINIKWAKVTGADKYRVYRRSSRLDTWTKVGDTKKLSFTDKTAESGYQYYMVKAYHGSVKAWSTQSAEFGIWN